MERDDGRNVGTDINPEVEEDGEAHLRQKLATDLEFRRAWEEGQARRKLGMFVLEKRMELSLSQRVLAERAGTSQTRIYLIENGETNPTLETLEKLAEALEVEVADFFPKAQAPLFQPEEVGEETQRASETLVPEDAEDDPFDEIPRDLLVRLMGRYSRLKRHLDESQDEQLKRVGGGIADKLIRETFYAIKRKDERASRTHQQGADDATSEAS
jgi:transcriptional regulator with XRE-family HTH domain